MDKKRTVIAVDLDDVLAPTSQCIIDHYAKQVGRVLPYGDITAYEYWQSVGVLSDEDAIRIVHGYEISGYPGLEPYKDALAILPSMKDDFIFVLVTARPERLREITESWIDRFFPKVFSTIFLTGNPYTSIDHITKAEACAQLGASCLIDDQLKHCAGAVEIGLEAILFGEFDWNNSLDIPRRVLRCPDWKRVKETVYGKY